MKKILTARSWLLFVILILMPLLISFIFLATDSSKDGDEGFFKYYSYFALYAILGFNSWLFIIGTSLYKKLPDRRAANLIIFKISILFPIFYLLCVSILVLMPSLQLSKIPFWVFLPLQFFLFLCFFYSFYIVSKMLRSVELGINVSSKEWIFYFILICFMPIGIWFLQPRISNIFKGQ